MKVKNNVHLKTNIHIHTLVFSNHFVLDHGQTCTESYPGSSRYEVSNIGWDVRHTHLRIHTQDNLVSPVHLAACFW